jgi:hypothetical protein
VYALQEFDGQLIAGGDFTTAGGQPANRIAAWGCACPADFAPPAGDGTVNVDDLLAVINAWGACPAPCPPTCPADITENCAVNVDDLLAVINAWGACP